MSLTNLRRYFMDYPCDEEDEANNKWLQECSEEDFCKFVIDQIEKLKQASYIGARNE